MNNSSTMLPASTTFFEGFEAFVAEEIPENGSVLDVGCGPGTKFVPSNIRAKARLFVGVDPDPRVISSPIHDEKYNCKLEDYALQERRKFDVICASFVVEHVDQPENFLRAVHGLLSPNGVFIAGTPNLNHYFGVISLVSQKLAVQEAALRILIGQQEINTYHHSTHYKMNRPAAIRKLGENAGFSSCELAMFDNPEHLSYYFPSKLHFIPRTYSNLVHHLKLLPIMATIYMKLRY